MNSNKKTFQETVDELRSCFQELGIPVGEEIIEDERATFQSCLDEGTFHIDVEVVCRNGTGCLDIAMEYSKTLKDAYKRELQKVVSYANWQVMDIGHFALDPSNTDIWFLASVPLYGDENQREQMITTLMRVVGQALKAFNILLRMLASDPAKVMQELAQEKLDRRKNDILRLN
jgi:hypothetical protein